MKRKSLTEILRNNEPPPDPIIAAVRSIADAITYPGMPGQDETGGGIASLTEAVMGVTAGLCRIAESLSEVAEAIRESKK